MPAPRPARATNRALARDERQRVIADYVLTHGSATPAELVEITGVSLMTVHRDLDELARRALLRKFHGGVSARPSSVFEATSEYRMNVQVTAKHALAEAALARLEPGMSVLLDTSTTNIYLARRIVESPLRPLTVITNYLPILQLLSTERDIQLLGVGGEYAAMHDAFFGIHSVQMVQALSANLAFLSTSSMTASTTYHQLEDIVAMKQAMIEAAERSVLLMDPTKIRRRALHELAPSSRFSEVILTDPDDAEFVAELRAFVPVTILP